LHCTTSDCKTFEIVLSTLPSTSCISRKTPYREDRDQCICSEGDENGDKCVSWGDFSLTCLHDIARIVGCSPKSGCSPTATLHAFRLRSECRKSNSTPQRRRHYFYDELPCFLCHRFFFRRKNKQNLKTTVSDTIK
jgi:hypothetical protein